MRVNGRIHWRSGVGSEIMTAVTLVLGLVMLYAVVVFSASYDAMVRGQIVTDIVIDGSMAYAKDSMEVSKMAFEKMAEKICKANNELVEDGASFTLQSVELGRAVDNISMIKSAEARKFLYDRAKNITTQVITVKFKLNKIGENQWPDPTKPPTAPENCYSFVCTGPLYMDQIARVTVESSVPIPLLGVTSSRTVTASSLSIAKDKYNARLDAQGGVLRNGSVAQIEKCLYAELLEDEVSPSDRIDRGSVPYLMMTAAKKYLGDGYANRMLDSWPSSVAVGGQWYPGWPEQPWNHYGHCKLFLDACAAELGRIEGAASKYGATFITRDVEYKRSPDADAYYLYDISHREQNKREVSGDDMEAILEGHTTGSVVWYKGKKYYISRKIKSGEEVTSIILTPLYGDEIPGHLDKLENHMRPYYSVSVGHMSVNDLKAGDILIYTDPNKESEIQREMYAIEHASSRNDPILAQLNANDGHYIAHYAMYIGHGLCMESGAGEWLGEDGPGVNGIPVAQIEGTPGEETRFVTEIIRFPDKATPTGIDIVQYIRDHDYVDTGDMPHLSTGD